VKVAVLGLGSAGARHASNLLELGHEVVGFDPVAPPHDGRVERAGSLEAALDRADAVVVASPSSLHAEQALAVLEQGRHVLVEKPLAVNVADAERVVEAAGRAGTVCGVAMNLRFHPALVELRRLLADGALGSVRFVQASFGYDLRLWHPGSDYRTGYSARADLGGGIVLDAIHELDYLLWLFGPVESVVAEVAHVSDLELDVEDVAVAALRFASGAVAAVDLNFFEPAYRRGCILVGSQAVARWDWSRATVTVSREGDEDEVVDVTCDLAETYRAELVDFLSAVAGRGAPRTPAMAGLDAVHLAEAAKRSALAGRRIAIESE
jgi:predicted dehydrogenase